MKTSIPNLHGVSPDPSQYLLGGISDAQQLFTPPIPLSHILLGVQESGLLGSLGKQSLHDELHALGQQTDESAYSLYTSSCGIKDVPLNFLHSRP